MAFRCGSRPPRWCPAGGGCDREDDHTHMEPTQEFGHGYRWVGPHRAVWWRQGMDRVGSGKGGKGGKGARRGRQDPRKHTGWGVDGVLGPWPGAALTASSPWCMKPWLWVRRGERGGHHIPFSFSEGLGAWVVLQGIFFSLSMTSSCFMPQFPHLR